MAAALLQLFVLTAVAGEAEFSQAETLLWMTDQLKMIEQPLQLNYAFERTGTFEPGFSDKVTFTIRAVKDDGTKAASVEMNRLTDPDGKSRERWRYFQRRIKFAMADAASVENVTVNFNGEALPAVRVSFSPYANDPKRALFEEFADKSYRIVVSDKIPGYIYSIETVIPGSGPDDLPLIREFLQLVSVEPGTAAHSAALTK